MPSAEPASRRALGTRLKHVLGRANHDRDHQDRERHSAGDGREVTHRRHHDLVDEKTDHDRRRAEQNVVDEANDKGEPRILAVFRQVGASQHAERRADGDADHRHDQAADDRIQETAVAARRRRHLREDVERQPCEALPEQHHENHEQSRQADGRGRDAQAQPHGVSATSRGSRKRRACGYLPAWISSRISMSLAIARTTKVIMNKIRPSAISDEV